MDVPHGRPLPQLIDPIVPYRATAIPGTGGPEIHQAWHLLDDEEETVLRTLIDQNVGDPTCLVGAEFCQAL